MMLQRLGVLACAAALTVACGQSDAGITTAVKSKLAADTTVQAYEIDVDTANRVVTLTGEVETSAAKEQALLLARDTDGVRDVVDQLRVVDTAGTTGERDDDMDVDAPDADEIERDARDTAGDAAGAVTDAGITSAVKAKLLGDTAVSGLQINVDTSDGVVTLSGRVNTQIEADEALRLARETTGVKRVVDKLEVGR